MLYNLLNTLTATTNKASGYTKTDPSLIGWIIAIVIIFIVIIMLMVICLKSIKPKNSDKQIDKNLNTEEEKQNLSEPLKLSEEENKTPQQTITENENQHAVKAAQKTINWWKIIAIVLITIIAIFCVVKFIEFTATNNQNNDGATKLISRSARTSDISIDTDIDWSNFGTRIIITPNVDIDDLKITIDIKNSQDTTIYTTQKFIGDVKKSIQTSCTVSISELGLKNSINAEKISIIVSGGTVQYFS